MSYDWYIGQKIVCIDDSLVPPSGTYDAVMTNTFLKMIKKMKSLELEK